MNQQEIYEARKTSKTAREVTFMNVTTLIDPLVSRRELQRKAEQGFISPANYYDSLKAYYRQMTDKEKEIEFAEIS